MATYQVVASMDHVPIASESDRPVEPSIESTSAFAPECDEDGLEKMLRHLGDWYRRYHDPSATKETRQFYRAKIRSLFLYCSRDFDKDERVEREGR